MDVLARRRTLTRARRITRVAANSLVNVITLGRFLFCNRPSEDSLVSEKLQMFDVWSLRVRHIFIPYRINVIDFRIFGTFLAEIRPDN